MQYTFSEIVDIPALQALMDSQFETSGILTAIIDTEGIPLLMSGWQEICLEFHRKHPETKERCLKSDLTITSYVEKHGPPPGGSLEYRCQNGLTSLAFPIVIDGRHIASLFTGQYLTAPPDVNFFRRQAERYGFDPTSYLEALKKVPIYSREEMEKQIKFLGECVTLLTRMGLQKLKELKVQQQIDASEKRFRSTFEISDAGMAMVSAQMRFLDVNPAFCRMTGYSKDELLAMSLPDLTPDEDRDNIHPIHEKHFSGRLKNLNFERRLLRKDGTINWVHVSTTLLHDSNGDPDYSIGIVQDITQRKKAEEKLKQRQAFETLIAEISSRFVTLSTSQTDLGIEKAVEELARSIEADRGVVLLISEDEKHFHCTYEWCAENVKPLEHFKQKLAFERPWLLEKLFRKEPVYVQKVSALPPEANKEYETCQSNGIQSVIAVPIVTQTRVIGLLGFDTVFSEKSWQSEDLTLLKTAGEIIGHAIERKRTQEKIVHLSQFRESIIDSTNMFLNVLDVQGNMLVWNRAAEKITGYNREEVLGHAKVWEWVYPEKAYRERLKALTKQMIESNQPIEGMETVIRCRNGENRTLAWNCNPLLDENGGLIGFVGIGEDITERRRAKNALRESEERFRSFFHSSAVGMTIISPDGHLMEVNPALAQFLGYEPSGLLGKSVEDITHPDDLERTRCFYQKTRAGVLPFIAYEKRYLHRNGSFIWGHATSTPVFDEDGNLKYFVALVKDINQRKKTEEALAYREAFESLITEISSNLVKRPLSETDEGIELALEKLGKFVAADCTYVFLLSKDGSKANNTHEWHAEGRPSLKKVRQNIALNDFPWAAQKMKGKEAIFVPRVVDLPPEASAEKDRWIKELRESCSLLAVPILSQDKLIGLLCFDAVLYEHQSKEKDIALLQTVADIIGGALERQRVGKALGKSQERLSLALQTANEGVWDWNLVDDRMYFGPRYYTMLGYEPDEFPASFESWLNLLHPEDRPAAEHMARKAKKTGEKFEIEYRMRAKKGHYIDILDAGQGVTFDRKGAPVRLVGTHRDITLRKKAENELQKSKALLEESQRITGLGTWEMDLTTNKVFWSDQLYHLVGKSPKNFHPDIKSLFEIIHPDDKKALQQALERALEGHPKYHLEHRVILHNGEIRHFEVQGEVQFNKQGRPVRALGTTLDITERKRAEEAIRRSEERFRRYFEMALVGMAITSTEKGWVEVNDKLCEMLGYTKEELLQKTWLELTHPADREPDLSQFNRILSGEIDGYSIDKRFIRKDGNPVYTIMSVKCLRRQDGSIDHFVALLQDITERKEAEKIIKKALTETAYARDQIDTILKSVADGLIYTDMANRILLMNRPAETILGLEFSEVAGKIIEDFIEDGVLKLNFENLLSGGKENIQTEFDLAENGIVRSIQAKSSLVRERDGNKSGIITLLRDITRERELDRIKSEFISTAAHELRTPLTSVKGFSELLLSQKFEKQTQNEFLSLIHEKSKILERIIADMLNLSRVESGRIIHLETCKCELNEVLNDWAAQFMKEHVNRRFKMNLPQDKTRLLIDRGKLIQVLDNLASNSVKFSAAKSLIQLHCKKSAEELRISIKDEGIGMTPEQVGRIFDKFYRVDSSNTAAQGLGLGMTIVKNIIEAHGGRIWVESEPKKGTTVTFTLPM